MILYKNENCCAIERKFTETFSNRQENHVLKEKYLTRFNGWDTIPAIRRLAESVSPNDEEFRYLHPAQLIKHILGLLIHYKNDKSKFQLVYLYYDTFGEEGYFHRKEVETFGAIARQDGVNFQSRTW